MILFVLHKSVRMIAWGAKPFSVERWGWEYGLYNVNREICLLDPFMPSRTVIH